MQYVTCTARYPTMLSYLFLSYLCIEVTHHHGVLSGTLISNLGLFFGRTLTMRRRGRLKPAESVCRNGRSLLKPPERACAVWERDVGAGSSVLGGLGAEARRMQKDNVLMSAP